MISVELPEALYPVFAGNARYRVAYGGRGSAKSWAFARMALVRAYERKRRILCARELQNSIKESVYQLLVDQIAVLGLGGFEVGQSYIRHQNGSEFVFKGLKSNISEIKSMEGIDICWVEEAQKVSQESWDTLIPTIRAEGSEIWVTFNPYFKTDPTSERFIEAPPPQSKVVKINYPQNPWFPDELRIEMEYLKSIDFERYKNVWLGDYKDPASGGRVVPAWSFANVMDVAYDPKHRIYLTCDFNVDPMCWALAHIYVVNGRRNYHFFDEIVRENSNIIATAKQFAAKYGNHKAGIIITGDSSGKARTDGTPDENQTRYDLLIKTLSDYGVENVALDAPRSNPLIGNRRETFNLMVCDPLGERRVRVDFSCKQIIKVCEGLHYVTGDEQIWQPTPKQIEQDPRMKFERNDMYDAVSYLVNRYDGRVEKPNTAKKPRMGEKRYTTAKHR